VEAQLLHENRPKVTKLIGMFCNFLLEMHLEEVLTESYVSQECPVTVTVLCKCNIMVGECCYIICDKFGVIPLT